jgi:hypothetical protein
MREYKLKLPEVGKTYYYFDDGKVSISRRMEVVITEIVPFSEIDEETLNNWEEEVREIDWIYAKETDYFVKGKLKVSDEVNEIVFVRTINNDDGWFSIGFWGGQLDIDGSLNAMLNRFNVPKPDQGDPIFHGA